MIYSSPLSATKQENNGNRGVWGWLYGRLAWVPVILLIVAAAILYVVHTGVTFESQVLLATLNTLFCSSVSLLIVYLSARSYLATGSRAVLTLGCSSLVFAIINLLGGILLTDLNVAYIVYNVGICMTGFGFILSAFWAFSQNPRVSVPARAPFYLGFSYSIALVVLGSLLLGALGGVIPAFYLPDTGATQLRQAVLAVTVIEFIVASTCFILLYRQSRSPLMLWYCQGLLLIGLGIGIVAIATPGMLLNWLGRGGQYLGALYMMIGIWSLTRGGGDWRIPLEKAIRETEKKYRRIVETAKEGIWMVDAEGRTIFANSQMAGMLGVSSAELVGKKVSDFVDVGGITLVRQTLEQKQAMAESHEQKFVRKDGTVAWAIISSTPMTDDDGKFAGSLSMITDITRRKLAEEELAEAKAQAELYLDLMSHDLNNMHQVAMGYLELIGDRVEIGSEYREIIDKPYEVLQRCTRLIDNVRKLQKIREGGIKHEIINLNDVLSYVISEYAGIPGKTICKAYDESQMHYVKADQLLSDVFSNLIGNAVKHSDGVPVSISINIESVRENGTGWYRLSVEDTGHGISDAMKDKVFNRLQRGDTKVKGMGLGLYLVKTLVESYGGCIWVEDRVPGDYTKGARFVVTLQAAEP